LIKKEDKNETKQNGQGSLSNQDIMYEIFKQENLDNDQIIEKIKVNISFHWFLTKSLIFIITTIRLYYTYIK